MGMGKEMEREKETEREGEKEKKIFFSNFLKSVIIALKLRVRIRSG